MKQISLILSLSILQIACSQKPSIPPYDQTSVSLNGLGSLSACQNYQGLPEHWQKDPFAGMVLIQGGTFEIGNNQAYPEEKSLLDPLRQVDDFYMDQTEVTNAQFQSFITATGYVTEAEKQGEAAVFIQPQQAVKELGWWSLQKGYSWKFPKGKTSQGLNLPNEPVRFITLKDAIAYADWLGHELPTEAQWEYAARTLQVSAENTHAHQPHMTANLWQGQFPYQNKAEDGFADVAPVGCFSANSHGIYDMIGNVWEYTRSPFTGSHDDHLGNHQQIKTAGKNALNYVIKGGSYLCADNYCARGRASARQSQEANLAMSHVGFRTVKNKNTLKE